MEHFHELKYCRPDGEKTKTRMQEIIDAFEQAASFEDAHNAFFAWHRFNASVESMYVIAYIRNTVNMKDEFYSDEINYYDEALPMLTPIMKKWSESIIDSKFRPQLEEIYGSYYFHSAEVQNKLLNDAIIAPSIEENRLSTEYSKTVASCSTDFRGENITAPKKLQNFVRLSENTSRRSVTGCTKNRRRESVLTRYIIMMKISFSRTAMPHP